MSKINPNYYFKKIHGVVCFFFAAGVGPSLFANMFLIWVFRSALVWRVIQLPVCVVWPKTKLNSSGSATPSYNRSASSFHYPVCKLGNWSSLFAAISSTCGLKVVFIQTCFFFFVANTSTWTLHPACNRSCCWRGSKQISGNDHHVKYYFKLL